MRELTMPTPQLKDSKSSFADWLKFNTFGDHELQKVVDGCQEWGNAMRDNPMDGRWLSIIGKSGTGKTHCAAKMWEWAMKRFDWTEKRFQPRSIFWPDFVQRLRAGDYFSIRTDMKTWPVLFLDDIGAERDPSGFASEELNTLLGCRVGRWTILTSNTDLDGLRLIDQRIASRIVRGNNICVGVNTMDYAERQSLEAKP